MSRIGTQPITIPSGIKVEVQSDIINVKGPKGELQAPLFDGITIKQAENEITVERKDDSKPLKAKHGLVRSLLANSITGTNSGFEKTLKLEGVGYRAVKKGKQLVMTLGYSHDVVFEEPDDVKIEVPDNTTLKISGIDKQRVGQVAAVLRSKRPPEPYKGKGVRYHDEVILRKAGKAGKK